MSLLWVQFRVTRLVVKRKKKYYYIAIILVMVRGILDITEDILLTLLMKEIISDKIVPIVSCITSVKLSRLGMWVIAVSVYGITIRNKRLD